jgi:hypothetical protein
MFSTPTILSPDQSGIDGHVRHELGLAAAHDAADHTDGPVERLDHRVVPALGADAHQIAVAHVDRRVAVAEPVDQDRHDLVEPLGRRTVTGQGTSDGFDRGDLSGSATHTGARRTRVGHRSLQRRDRPAGACREDDGGRSQRDPA